MKASVILFAVLFTVSSFAETWEIVEKDFVQTARDYAKTEDFRKKVETESRKKMESIENMEGVGLPAAEKDEEYTVEYSYTLPADIPKVDREGNIIGILYPKGYTFNPLLYIAQAPPPMIIFNPCNPDEKAFVDSYTKDLPDYMLVASGCPLKNLSGYDELVYLVDAEMVKKFKLKYTVSMVSVDISKGVFNVSVFKVGP